MQKINRRPDYFKGRTYVLGVNVGSDIKIPVGRLGKIGFNKGFYLYIGSAKDRLYSRLRRHLSDNKKIFWHIDYLLASGAARLKKIWVDGDRSECSIARSINHNLASNVIRRFGNSDCRCAGHLIFIDDYESLGRFLKQQGFKQIRL